MRLAELYQKGLELLHRANIPDADLDAAVIIGHVLGLDRTRVLLAMDTDVAGDNLARIEGFFIRRSGHEPLAYIFGEWEFWSLPFTVSPDVLVPRPETEVLVEQVLAEYQDRKGLRGPILDLGTGSGILAVVLALEFSAATVFAVDCSPAAVKVALHNARRHGCDNRVHGLISTWSGGISAKSNFEIIVSNPPYVARELCTGDVSNASVLRGGLVLESGVRIYEPNQALDGGERGMECILCIASELPGLLRPGGWLFMEIGADQKDEVLDLLNEHREFDYCEIVLDYAGLPRVLKARRKLN